MSDTDAPTDGNRTTSSSSGKRCISRRTTTQYNVNLSILQRYMCSETGVDPETVHLSDVELADDGESVIVHVTGQTNITLDS